jgi:hypothetical protein
MLQALGMERRRSRRCRSSVRGLAMVVQLPRPLVLLQLAVIAAALALLAACGSSGSTPSPHGSEAPSGLQPSPVGKPTGTSVTKSIGSAGGTLTSGDRGITVTIPAGALTSDTPIAIQPIENTAAGGLHAAYRLTPTGQTFTKPVQVSFPYSDADLDGTAPEALGIAFQDSHGLWEWQDNVALDTTGKRLTVMTNHFSDWSNIQGLQLRPGAATVKVKGQVNLVATSCIASGKYSAVFLRYKCGTVSDELAPLGVKSATWSVNGKAGGSGTLGTVKGDAESAVYTAPARKPTAGKSVVQVSVVASVRGKKTLLVANITITGGYHVTGSFKDANSGLVCAGTVSASVTDTVEFSLTPSADGSFTVTDIKNATTKYAAPKVPYVAIRPVVRKQPDIFFADSGSVEAGGSSDLVTVALDGKSTLGVCYFGGQVLGIGATDPDRTGLAFYTSKFVGGIQKNIPEDTGFKHWTWTVTEQ